jgi:transcriptional regulator with XRE-family HTH domain
MADKAGSFDLEAFYAALNSTRQTRLLNWKQVAEESGVSASTLTRMAQGKRPDVDGFAALAAWSRLDPGDFVRRSRTGTKENPEPEPLAAISTYLRRDRNLTPEAATAIESIIAAAYEKLRDREQ